MGKPRLHEPPRRLALGGGTILAQGIAGAIAGGRLELPRLITERGLRQQQRKVTPTSAAWLAWYYYYAPNTPDAVRPGKGQEAN